MNNFAQPLAGQNMTQLGSNQVLQNAYWTQLENSAMDAATREQGQTSIAAIATLLDNFDSAVLEVNSNPDLSAQGRASAILAKSTNFMGRLDTLTTGTLAGLTTQIKSQGAMLTQAAKGPDASVISEMRAREVRAQFAEVEDILRPSEYEKMARAGNVAACLAIEQAPGTPLLDAVFIAEAQAIRAAAMLPKEADGKKSAIEIFDVLTACVRAAKKHLDLAPTFDPLQIAARGM